MPEELHPLLLRQLKRNASHIDSKLPEIASFLKAVSSAYRDNDADRNLSEHALEISSKELVEANTSLRYQRDLFFAFMDNSPLVAYMKDSQGNYTYANRRLLQLAGRTWGELRGRTDAQVFGPEFAQRRLCEESVAKDAGNPNEVIEAWSDSETKLEWRMLRFKILDSRGEYTASVGTDVTEQKRIEEQLRQSQKLNAIGRLAGGIAHDFNNLLTVILGYAQTLLDPSIIGGSPRIFIDEIIKAAERAAALTRQLLVFSRKQVVQPKILNLNSILTEMERMLRRLIGEDIQLAALRQEGLWSVRADPGQIQQVIMNLALNARDAMPGGGKLTIETSNATLDGPVAARYGISAGSYVMLAVTDTGTGMTPEVRARLFEPFFTTKPVGAGTGLGLATTYGIVSQSQGQILVYTELGHGSAFKVFFPRILEKHSSGAPRIAIVPPKARNERILVVEDEEAVRLLITSRLTAQGYRVEEARNGAEALAIQKKLSGTVDLVITDVVMPQMGGFDLVKRLNADWPSLRVLFMSGYPDGAILQHGELAEDTPFLHKPFSTAEFLNRVRDTLDSPPRPLGTLFRQAAADSDLTSLPPKGATQEPREVR